MRPRALFTGLRGWMGGTGETGEMEVKVNVIFEAVAVILRVQ